MTSPASVPQEEEEPCARKVRSAKTRKNLYIARTTEWLKRRKKTHWSTNASFHKKQILGPFKIYYLHCYFHEN